ncbi:ferredoxin reductase family protein [Arthrobacter sp. ISL-48]|uniref:ferredoxin reductase family protein n=1 Tax=Arthrobacter sp. ISL-48 TaxID=2819110 RepID=UPI001BE56768|nr:ferredoxin reductase family protein [Arthrobacter sp. ISL-48]MBT2533725.1 ferredoxin reductase family protein [Arthrobacter sp. ISL-48]
MKTQLLPAPPADSRSGRPELRTGPRGPSGSQYFVAQHRRRRLRADALTVTAWSSVAAAVALWLADGGATVIDSAGSALTALGIVAGLTGMDLVLLMLLLVARIPLIDQTIGHDRALEFHGKLGKPSLYLLLAHGLLIAVGYGMAEGLDPISESVALWVQVPDMWLAFISMALFIAVVVTSLAAVRRRFPYEFWYAVHLLTYAAVGTSIPHQFSVGALFAEGTWQRWYWMAICIATGTALLYYRVLQPVLATSRHQLTVSRVQTVARDVVNIEMTGRQLNRLTGSGGRFFVWRFLAPGLWWHPHPFSLSSEPRVPGTNGEGSLRITVRNLGRGSSQLLRLRPGTKVAVEGPYGLFGTAARSREKVVMIGAGIGITPLRALLERTPFTPGNATVLLRGHSEQELYLSSEILEICRSRGVRLFHLTGPRAERSPHSWLPEDAVRNGHNLAAYAPDIADSDVYICGPAAWARSVIADAGRAGVRPEQIHHERFDW